MESEKSIELVVYHEHGLHARPAADLVRRAAAFQADIRIRNLSRDTGYRNAKSLTDLLLAAVDPGHRVEIVAVGEDAEAAVQSLAAYIQALSAEKENQSASRRG